MTHRVLASVLAVALCARSASADEVVAYQAEGGAPASAADARTMALDDAFAGAARAALADLVSAEVRAARKAELDKEIVGRARLWVAKFSVTRDETVDERRELTVSVRVDRDKLRARLAELGVAVVDVAPSGPAPRGDGDAPQVQAPPAQRTATVLLRVRTPEGVRAGFGAGAAQDLPGLAALTRLLRGHGLAVRRAPASGRAAGADDELPASDEQAEALAREAKADVVAIAGIEVGEPAPVRGLAATASLVTARVRVLDRAGESPRPGEGSATAAARGEQGVGLAVDRALTGAARDALPAVPPRLGPAVAFSGDDTPVADPGVVLVRLPARTPYGLVQLEQKHLVGARGVRGATLRRVSPAGWVIGVATGEPIEQVARIASKAPSPDTSASAKIVGGLVELRLTGTP